MYYKSAAQKEGSDIFFSMTRTTRIQLCHILQSLVVWHWKQVHKSVVQWTLWCRRERERTSWFLLVTLTKSHFWTFSWKIIIFWVMKVQPRNLWIQAFEVISKRVRLGLWCLTPISFYQEFRYDGFWIYKGKWWTFRLLWISSLSAVKIRVLKHADWNDYFSYQCVCQWRPYTSIQ